MGASSEVASNGYDLDDGWLIRLEYQADDTWDLSAGSVTDGTLDWEYSTADVGTSITALAWELDGTTLTAWYSTTATPEYPGDFTQIGSDITSAPYQGVANVGASYNGATGSQLLPNNDFSAWTISTVPDGWSLSLDDVNNYVEENVSGVRFVNDTIFRPRLSQSPSVDVGDDVILLGSVAVATLGGLIFYIGGNFFTLSTVSKNAIATTVANTGGIRLYTSLASTDAVSDEISLWMRGTLDNDTDGAIELRSG